jgi:hypothetical protein
MCFEPTFYQRVPRLFRSQQLELAQPGWVLGHASSPLSQLASKLEAHKMESICKTVHSRTHLR